MSTIKKLSQYAIEIAKYLVIFIILHTIINLWRSPDVPEVIELRYQNAQGQITDIATLSHDEPVLVYFWGTWCGVCRLTSPNIQALHKAGYPVLSVAVSSGNDNELTAYMNQHGYEFATVNDDEGAIFRAWQGQVTPSFVIINKGQMSQSFTGLTPLWTLKLRLWLASF